MSATNARLAEVFGEMASILELTGANSFRVSAYARVGRALKDLTVDVATLADAEPKLTAIEGVGPSSARKIMEFVRTGRITEHQNLLERVPPGLVEILAIPGLGPKTIRVLWQEGGVTDLDSLKRKLAAGELEDLPRMGAKSLENLRKSIEFSERAGRRTRLGRALPLAEEIVAAVSRVPGVSRAQYAGSLRRGAETIGDVDVLACTSDPPGLSEAFCALPGVEQVLVAGHTKVSVRMSQGVQADLRIVPEGSFGAALAYFTGSKAHNVALRERAVRRGLRLNEYGLFPDDGDAEPPQNRGVAPLAAATEEAIYEALELPWIPPELREDRGELAAAALPDLIERGDIRAELHAHTVASDGRLTIDELAEEAARRGFHTIAVTDHSHASAQAGGLSAEELLRHVEAIREADARHEGIRILAGTEVDILADGRLDYDDEVLAELDVVVASPHVALRQDPARATRRLLAAIRHPLVHIIGHPTGRVVERREGLVPDITALVEAAAEHGTALEINANFMRLDLRDVHVRAAVEAGALIAIDTDAHTREDFDNLRYGVLTARRGWLRAERCLNAWPAERLHGWLAEKRTQRSQS